MMTTKWWRRLGGVVAVAALAGALVACSEAASSGDGGGRDTPSPTGTAVGDPDPPMVEELAPIDEAEVLVRESFPPQYALRVLSGLPSGCAEFHSAEVERDGDTFKVTVLNLMPAPDSETFCTAIYGTHESTLELGSDLVSGTEYTVDINDGAKVLTFTAQ